MSYVNNKMKSRSHVRCNCAEIYEPWFLFLTSTFSYYTPVGLDNVCPSTVAFPTKVKVYDTECYIVKPEKQCISYAKCEAKTWEMLIIMFLDLRPVGSIAY